MKRHLLALGFGLLGMGVALVLWHAWVDHQTWHVLLTNLAAQSQRVQQQVVPRAPVTP